MAKRKSIRDLSDSIISAGEPGVVAASPTEIPSADRKRRSAPLNSPLLNRPEITESPFKSEIVPLPLPVSGKDTILRYEELDPGRCVPSDANPREQQLLSMADPDIARIAQSVSQEGQRDPVLARVIQEDGGNRFEIIYGTTRLFIARELGIKLKAWVGEIPDIDVRRLARAENSERRDLSPWEKANDLQRQMNNIYIGRTQEFVAEQEGIDRSVMVRLLRLCDIDVDVLKLLTSPQVLSVNAGLKILAAVEKSDSAERSLLVSKAKEDAPYATGDLLAKKLLQLMKGSAPQMKVAKRRPVVVTAADGSEVMRVAAHRDNEGQYKVDLYGFSPQELEEVVAFVRHKKGIRE